MTKLFKPVPRASTACSTTPGSSSLAASAPTKKRHAWWWVAVSGAAVLAIGVLATTEIDWQKLQDSIAGLNGLLVFFLMATLPVAGFSVGIIYLVAGAKFGPVVGGLAVAGATACHLLLTHWVCQSFLRAPVLRVLARRKHHLPAIPAGENASISVMAALVPGVPYFARNYLLALSGVPLRTYFWICLPIYVARSYVTIFLGDLSGDPSRRGFIVLVAVYVVKLGVCAWLLARLRRRFKRREEDATPSAASASGPKEGKGRSPREDAHARG